MADSKTSLNLGGSTTASFVVDITGSITDMRQSLNLAVQEVRNLNNELRVTKSLVSGIQLGGMGGGGGVMVPSSNKVAPDPKFSPPSQAPLAITAPGVSGGMGGGGGGGFIGNIAGGHMGNYGAGPGVNYTGATNLTEYVKKFPGSAALFATNLLSGMVTSPADAVEAQLLMQRSSYFSGGRASYGDINSLQARMAAGGMANDNFDSMRALAAAQNLGITGPNITGGAFGGVAMGVSAASNLVPGMGMEGTMRAYASMQQPRNVNMLRGLGIRLRDDQGNLKPPGQIIEDIWTKITRDYAGAYGSGKVPSEQELLIGLQPGNSMDSFLDQYFGNDPMAKQMVANGLLYKAKLHGGGDLTKLTPAELQKMGGTTTASNMFFKTQAQSARGLGIVAEAGAAGYESAAGTLLKLSTTINDYFAGPLKALTEAMAYYLTWLGAGGGAIPKVFSFLQSRGQGKAAGGPVNTQVPYVVGEKGPELFVPKTDGTIIPNHKLPAGMFKGTGGTVTAGGHEVVINDKRDFASAVLYGIGAPLTQENLSSLMWWMNNEDRGSGAMNRYNPLNTTLKYGGGTSFNKAGVKSYTNWQEGLDATLSTILNSRSSYGYGSIVEALKQNKGLSAVQSAINSSSWTGKKGGYSSSATGSSTYDPLNEMDQMLNNLAKYFGEDPASLKNVTGGGFGSMGSGGILDSLMGPRTAVINVFGTSDINKVADQVMSALKQQGFLQTTGKS